MDRDPGPRADSSGELAFSGACHDGAEYVNRSAAEGSKSSDDSSHSSVGSLR